MNTKLNWFDRLMTAVTFAEAGVAAPEHPEKGHKGTKNTQAPCLDEKAPCCHGKAAGCC